MHHSSQQPWILAAALDDASRRKPSITRLAVENHPDFDGHEEVVYCHDATSGLKAVIAIHSTKLGPALGGCRMWPYVNREEALADVLRLSQGMSYKQAVAHIDRGGGKAVILGDPLHDKTPDLVRAFGQFVEELSGRYITAEDVGMSVEDMVLVREETKHVAGLPIELGGSGDPSPMTAYGVFCGIQAAVAFRHAINRMHTASRASKDSLAGVTVAVQGIGKVGRALCRHLTESGAELIVTDIHQTNVAQACDEFGATPAKPDEIYDVQADVFAPCALGAVLTPTTVERLKATIVAGAANNQLANSTIASLMRNRGILYAPDYVINAGGVMNISYENEGYDGEKATAHTARIGNLLTEIFSRAVSEKKTTEEVAGAMARAKLAS